MSDSTSLTFNNLPKLFSEEEIEKWLINIARYYDKEIDELNYKFCDDEEILAVNQNYLQHDYYTDIISFPSYNNANNKIGGDIIISIETVASNAQKYTVSYKQELLRVIVHGLLHLIGFNDKTDSEQLLMTEAENKSLNNFNHK